MGIVGCDYTKLAPLPVKFFLRQADVVAKDLLGKGFFLVHKSTPLLVEITEVEAYLHNDPASHSYCGITRRNWPMFEPGGTSYVYLSYGINYCLNVATGPKGVGEAVLIRSACPIVGIEFMKRKRKTEKVENLLSGPGKLTQALSIDLRFNGKKFSDRDFKLVDLGKCGESHMIQHSPRIGISSSKDLPLRFTIKGSKWLSRKY